MSRIICGDALTELKKLPGESVHCCVTSPPYWGLRDYGVPGQIGLEKMPEEYVEKMVAVFAEVRRVLRDDGTLWLNLGDSYSSQAGQRKPTDHAGIKQQSNVASTNAPSRCVESLGPKQLVGIPWRVAFALQASGWYLRQDIIWSKPNPMPESVTDRCTKSHEYIFLLSKSARYFYDNEAVKEAAEYRTPNAPDKIASPYGQGFTRRALKAETSPRHDGNQWNECRGRGFNPAGRSKRDSFKRENSKRSEVFPGQSVGTHRMEREESAWDIATRNRRSVWTISTRPFSEAHFATFPPEIPEICIKAGCPPHGTVLDPFGGAGTVGLVAEKLGREYILIELNPKYVEMAEQRIERDCGLLLTIKEE